MPPTRSNLRNHLNLPLKSLLKYWDYALVVFVIFLSLYDLRTKWTSTVFLTRDLDRAASTDYIAGLGPEVSGGGNLFGGLYYLILKLAIGLYGPIHGPYLLAAIGYGVGLLIFGSMVRNLTDSKLAGLWSLCALGSMRAFWTNIKFLANNSFAFPFIIISIYFLSRAILAKKSSLKGTLYFSLFCVATVMGGQTHGSVLALFLVAFFLLLRHQISRPWVGILLGIITTWIFSGNSLESRSAINLGKGLILFLSGPMSPLQSKAGYNFLFQLPVLLGLTSLFPLLLYFFSKRTNIAPSPDNTPGTLVLKEIALTLALISAPFMVFFIFGPGQRYLILPAISLSLLSATHIHQIPADTQLAPWIKGLISIGSISLLLAVTSPYPGSIELGIYKYQLFESVYSIGLFLILISIRKKLPFFIKSLTLLALILPYFLINTRHAHWRIPSGEAIGGLKFIQEATSWSKEETARRLFMVNAEKDSDLMIFFPINKPLISPNATSSPSGYFWINTRTKPELLEAANVPMLFLLKQNLPKIIASELQDGVIRLGKTTSIGQQVLVEFYLSQPRAVKLAYMQNLPLGYTEDRGARFVRHPEWKGTLNLCRNESHFCDLSTAADWHAPFLRVEVSGPSISQRLDWIWPKWNHSLQDVGITVECPGGGSTNFSVLNGRIGFDPEAGMLHKGISFTNNSLLGPLAFTVQDPCRNGERPLAFSLKFQSLITWDLSKSPHQEIKNQLHTIRAMPAVGAK